MRKDEYLILFKRLLLGLLFYPLVRMVFYFCNLDYFSGIDLIDIISALVYGLRFDLSTLLVVNAPFIILSVIPFRRSGVYNFLLKILFIIPNIIALIINIVDLEFFSFLGKKMTVDILEMGNDISDQFVQLSLYYWYLSVPAVLLILILWKLYPTLKSSIMYERELGLSKTLPLALLIIVMTFIGIRGGVQLRSISSKEAFVFERYELGNLAINSTYTMIRSIGQKGLIKVSYFESDELAVNELKKIRDYSVANVGSRHRHSRQNIMLIIVESLSQEYIENGYAPFFNKLASQSLYYNTNFANGRRSLEALPSILSGVPSLIGKPIYQTQYQSNKFYGLPKLLKNEGYSTSFFHGGKKGTMDFDAYTKSIGVDHYYALEDYPDQNHYDGHWGVYDHYYLNYVADMTDKVSMPFFSTIFTLSSHQPYSIPTSIDRSFAPGTLEIHKSIRYVDYSLEQFFEKIKLKSWYEDTLFIITADHTQKLESDNYKNALGRYRVPLLLYHPKIDLREYKKERVTQHIDILPSVLDFLGVENSQPLKYGTSIFNEDQGRMLNFISGNYLFYSAPYFLQFDGEKAQVYEVSGDMSQFSLVEDQDGFERLISELKAYIQLTNNGLKNNNLYSIQR